MNIVQLYDYIKQYALTIPIVKSYYNTSVYECWNNQNVKYGSVVFAVKSVREQNAIAKFDCVLYYGDRLNDNKTNRDAIQSDAIGVINNIVSRLNCSDNIEFVTYPVQSTIFEQKFADELAGAYANLTIDLQSTGDCCAYNLLDDYYTKEQIDNKLDDLAAGDLDLSDYYTKAQIDKKLTEIEEGDIDLTNYYTKQQIDSKGYLTSIPSQYVTETELNAKGYLTSVPSQYVTENELNAKKYLTAVPSEYVTESELEERLKNVSGNVDLTGYATEQWVEGKGYLNTSEVNRLIENAVTEGVDLSDYYTKQQIDNKGYLTEVPSQYATKQWVQNEGYLTSVPSQYITETELENRLDDLNLNVDLSDYYTKTQIDGKGFVTNAELVTKDYATKSFVEGEINNIDLSNYYNKGEADNRFQPKGNYLTSVPSEYVTETELTSKGYATTTQVSNKQDKLVSGNNIKTINGVSILGSGNIEIQGGTGGDVDLSDYFTKSETYNVFYTKEQVDAMVGAVNQILESLINDVDTEAIEVSLNNILNEK